MKSSEYSGLSLAFLGDAVFELCARVKVMENGEMSLSALNQRTDMFSNARSQANMYHTVIPYLNDDELAVLKRGRNTNPRSVPKGAAVSEYRHATGLESLFGYLYLDAKYERISQLFQICCDSFINTAGRDEPK